MVYKQDIFTKVIIIFTKIQTQMKTPTKSQMKTRAFVIALLFASVKKVKATCYAEEGGEPIENCTCDESCATCGYDGWPTETDQCLTCAEGLTHYEEWSDGTGYCRVAGV